MMTTANKAKVFVVGFSWTFFNLTSFILCFAQRILNCQAFVKTNQIIINSRQNSFEFIHHPLSKKKYHYQVDNNLDMANSSLSAEKSKFTISYSTSDANASFAKYDSEQQIFILQNKNIQYILHKNNAGKINHIHWGLHIKTIHPLPFNNAVSGGDEYSAIYQDFPIYGDGDDRDAALKLHDLETGLSSFDFVYKSHVIMDGKPLNWEGLPSTYVECSSEATTLMITLQDAYEDISIELYYTIFRDYDAIARHSKIINKSNHTFLIENIASWSLDLPPSPYENGYHFLQLQGAWAREAQETWNPIKYGKYFLRDNEGSKAHRVNPFFAVGEGTLTEEHGTVRGFSFIYSGSFQASLHLNQLNLLRVSLGLNPETFRWRLEPGEEFISPEAIAVYSVEGLGGMSRTFHSLYRSRLTKGIWRDKSRPILINTWEAMYFSFTHDTLIELAKSARDIVELFVLDDGWFGDGRNDDTSSLGDWYPNLSKLPHGLKGLADDINALGLEFGLWVEPESVNRNSNLYRNHPEWSIEIPGRRAPEMRNQLLLDLTNPKVREHLITTFSNLFSSVNIYYVKWDHNRYIASPIGLTLPPERQKEFHHRYILGLYEIVNTLTCRFPNILFENCSGGGGRFDPGMLYFMPQSWASDNTDVEERMKIQYSLSYIYPTSMMGTHVSTIPNHQVQRSSEWASRVGVAHFGTFGYELDVRKLSSAELNQALIATRIHSELREIIQFGNMYRLRNPFISNWPSWMIVSEDRCKAVVLLYQRLMHTRMTYPTTILRGLDEQMNYIVTHLYYDEDEKSVYSGKELMTRGLSPVQFKRDFEAHVFLLKQLDR